MNSSSDLRSVEGLIFAIDQTAIHDGPGVRMMIYLKGCPLHCVWCHSPESVSPRPEVVWYETRCVRCGKCAEVCPEGLRGLTPIPPPSAEAVSVPDVDVSPCRLCSRCVDACDRSALEIKGYSATAGRMVDEAVRLKPFFRRSGGGVTLSGGEPMLQPAFSYAIAALCQAADIHVALETTGHVHWARLKPMTRVVKLFLYDLKYADDAKHRAFMGVSNRLILANLARVTATGAEMIVRVPVIPGHNDSPEEIRAIARAAHDRGVTQITLLPYNPAAPGKYAWLRRPYPLAGTEKQSAEAMRALERIVEDEGLRVVAA